MAEYIWGDQENTFFIRISDNKEIVESSYNVDWEIVQEYISNGGEIDSYWTIDNARYWKFNTIKSYNTKANMEDFLYDGDLFVSDKDSIQAVHGICLSMTGTDLIPTPNGEWVLVDGSKRSFTVTDFLTFAVAFFMRSSNNFGVKITYMETIQSMYYDGVSTGEDIHEFDVSTGWF